MEDVKSPANPCISGLIKKTLLFLTLLMFNKHILLLELTLKTKSTNMKHLSRLLLASLFVLSFSAVQAQDENNPWAIGIGANAVDLYPTGEAAPAGGWFDEYFNIADHWNIIPGITRISVARYIGGGFVFEGAGSVNQIDKFGDEMIQEMSYYALDGGINYSLRALLNDGWLDPNIGVGGGYTWLDNQGAGTVNGKVGLSIWFSDNVALNLQSVYKYSFTGYESGNTTGTMNGAYDRNGGLPSHFQHSAGLKFIFGGRDTDGDGIYDKDDECPEIAGLIEFNGCPDTDADGIEDRRDACPNVFGLAQFDGCPDTDGDGIADPQDKCPTVAGLPALMGCPDADGDGIADQDDECPNEAGPAENNGCPYEDRDGDGVLDKDDECPDVAGNAGNNGCPEPTAEAISELNEYSRTVLFDLNKATIRPESEEALNNIAEIMQEYDNTIFHIEGHTDNTGRDEYNMQLSKERADSVRQFLISAGVPESRLTSEGYGETQPIAPNNTAQGRQDNRRVEISLDKNKEVRNPTQTDTTRTGN